MGYKAKLKYNLIEDSNNIKDISQVFENVTEINENEYSLLLSAYDLGELWDNETIAYFSPIQRGLKQKRTSKGKTITIPKISENNIREMSHLILNDDFFTSQLTLNILDDGKDDYLEYDPSSQTLHVKKQLLTLDGAHRILSVYRAWTPLRVVKDEELTAKLKNLVFPIKITHYDEYKAKSCFSSYSKQLKLSKSKTESYDMSKSWNRIVDRLNKNSVFAGMIDTNKVAISKNDEKNLVTFATFVNAIKEAFPVIQNETEEMEIFDFLVIFFKELTDVFPEMLNYEDRCTSKEYSLICENIMFYGWMSIASYLYLRRSKKGWKKEVKTLEKIDFDKDSVLWNSIMRPGAKGVNIINNKQTRSILCRILQEQFVINQD